MDFLGPGHGLTAGNNEKRLFLKDPNNMAEKEYPDVEV
jgi:hypothetical protein